MPFKSRSPLLIRPWKLTLISTALVLASACATPIKEEDFYTDKGADGAVETHFFSTAITDISLSAWNQLREGMTCMSAQAISDVKGEIEQLCTRASCDEGTENAKSAALAAIERVEMAQDFGGGRVPRLTSGR